MTGDRVWYEDVQEVIETHRPKIIVANGGDVQLTEAGSLIMEKDDIYEVYRAVPNAKVISVVLRVVRTLSIKS